MLDEIDLSKLLKSIGRGCYRLIWQFDKKDKSSPKQTVRRKPKKWSATILQNFRTSL